MIAQGQDVINLGIGNPDMAPNRPHAITPAIPNPPGNQLTRTLATLISLSTMVPAVIILPQRMKYNTTTRANLSMLRNRLWASRRTGRSVNKTKPITEVKKRHMNTGTVAAMHPRRISRITK